MAHVNFQLHKDTCCYLFKDNGLHLRFSKLRIPGHEGKGRPLMWSTDRITTVSPWISAQSQTQERAYGFLALIQTCTNYQHQGFSVNCFGWQSIKRIEHMKEWYSDNRYHIYIGYQIGAIASEAVRVTDYVLNWTAFLVWFSFTSKLLTQNKTIVGHSTVVFIWERTGFIVVCIVQ